MTRGSLDWWPVEKKTVGDYVFISVLINYCFQKQMWATLYSHTHKWGNSGLNTHIIFIAHMDVRDLNLQVFDDLSDQFLHKGVLFFNIWILCPTETNVINMRP